MFNEGSATLDVTGPATLASPRNHTPRGPVDFVPPPAWVGKIVMWRPDPKESENAAPAIVTRVSQKEVRGADGRRELVQGDMLALLVFVPDRENFYVRDGVRHRADPNWTQEAGDGGVWFETEGADERALHYQVQGAFDVLAKLIEAQGKVIAELTGRVIALEGILTDPKAK